MFGIGMQELLLILVVVLLIRNFRRASSEPDEIDITPKDKKDQSSSGDDSHKA